jgi:hypothetical protein
MKESEFQKHIQLTASRAGAKLFRNNVGQGWIGTVKRMTTGEILLFNPRPLHAGLHTGSGDLIGWKTITITPDMVGKQVAVFTSVEVKQGARTTAEQMHWMNSVNNAGGIAGIVKEIQELDNLLKKFGK